ncbi:MAG TPA: ATP-binding protein [Anaerolineae bacterium]|nr:ATP-binding protein [Anaerolineae bacterium]HQH37483.1 ATP-binding protein [Anaerolineae bacterium]
MNSSDEKTLPNPINLQIGGIAPNVLRELSGIYPTFVSAFKELVSNSYDADATLVNIHLSPDASVITVGDNGVGMTLLEFQQEYIRIGGSARRNHGGLTPGGRKPIGRKGIGFLAIARYCHTVEIRSHTQKVENFTKKVSLSGLAENQARIPVLEGHLAEVYASLMTIKRIRCGDSELLPTDYAVEGASVVLAKEAWCNFTDDILVIDYVVDNHALELKAAIDYDYLMGLGDAYNLESLQDFCQVQLRTIADVDAPAFTCIKLHLREFVRQELLTPQRRGRVRNIASVSGLDRFLWNLSRSIPTEYDLSALELQEHGFEALGLPISPLPFAAQVTGFSGISRALKRPLIGDMDGAEFDNAVLVKKQLLLNDVAGLSAQGYVLGFPNPIYPAELRGIAIRVRGVEIGPPGFLNVDNDVPVKYRALLNQISGEVIVTEGMDAVTAVMPGREGFYAESAQFQTLRKHLVGDGVSDFGILGQVLTELWERQSLESSVQSIIQEAKRRRKTFLDITHAVTELSVTSYYGRILQRLSVRTDIKANGLLEAPEHPVGFRNVLRDYALELTDSEESDYQIDPEHKVVRLNRDIAATDMSLYMLGRDFTLSFREGASDASLCEIDFATDTIYINWMHLTRSKLGDDMFIKSTLFWRLAYLAAACQTK